MPDGLTFLLGGVRSGKSALAVELARRHGGAVELIATAEAFDEDMAARIARHRGDRPAWPVREEPLDLAGALDTTDPSSFVVVDCLTVWVGNLMVREVPDAEIEARAVQAADRARARPAPTVVLSNEVGSGVHPPTELGRRYTDVLGRVNQVWSTRATTACLVVAGRALRLVDPWEVLGA
jgi:adenosyl cobinamide kinase/adenosyl cobinamide phosphate guanylyltransferase